MRFRHILLLLSATVAVISAARLEGHDICPCSGNSCCQRSASELKSNAEQIVLRQLKNQSDRLTTLLNGNLSTFKAKFEEMISVARNHTISLFEKKYSNLVSATLMNDTNHLFEQLLKYITRPPKTNGAFSSNSHQKDIKDIVKNYFQVLFKDVYHQLMNHRPRAATNHDFNECLQDMAYHDISPFGEVPNKLIAELEQSFDTAHALLGSLALASEVVNGTFRHLDLSEQCIRQVVRIFGCPKCSEVSSATKPCPGFCKNVFRGCLGQLADMDKPWANFILSLERLSNALLGHHNAENVLSTVDLKVEEALIQATSSSSEINKRVRIACGMPRRYAREARPLTTSVAAELPSEARRRGAGSISRQGSSARRRPQGVGGHHRKTMGNGDSGAAGDRGVAALDGSDDHLVSGHSGDLGGHRHVRGTSGPGLFVTIEGFVHNLKEYKNFFGMLGDSFCPADDVAPFGSSSCWNGHGVGEYTKTIAGIGLSQQKSNPEFSEHPNALPERQSPALNKLSQRLDEDAKKLSSLNVELFQRSGSSAEYYFGDGAASGDGSGDSRGPTIGLGPGSDDEDYNQGGEGSGDGGEGSGHGPTGTDFKIVEDNDINSKDDKSTGGHGHPGAPGSSAGSGSGTTTGRAATSAIPSPVATVLLALLVTIVSMTSSRALGLSICCGGGGGFGGASLRR